MYVKIPPGAACLKFSRVGRVRPLKRMTLLDVVRVLCCEAALNQRWYRVNYALCPKGQRALLYWRGIFVINMPMDVLSQHPVRKSKKQKRAFLEDVCQYAQQLGYKTAVERGRFGCNNIVIGDPSSAEYLITAHYDTCARMLIPNLITPCNFLTFLLYQLLAVLVVFAPAIVIDVVLLLILEDADLAFSVGYLVMWLCLLLMLFGPANKQNANDNTSGVVAVLEIAKSFPQIQRSKVCFVLFDLEEAGLVGSASYQRTHKKETANQIVLNLDCVGDGSELLFLPGKTLRKDMCFMDALRKTAGEYGTRSIRIHEQGFCIYPSDQNSFPLGLGIAAMHKTKHNLLYLSRIHTAKDTILDITNINILRACLISLICNHVVNKKGNEHETV